MNRRSILKAAAWSVPAITIAKATPAFATSGTPSCTILWHKDAGEDVGEGGYVYWAEPGVYKNVALLDVASMHPASIENLEAFGPYTEKFSELKAARIAIKRGTFDGPRLLPA